MEQIISLNILIYVIGTVLLMAEYNCPFAESLSVDKQIDYEAVPFHCNTWKRVDISWENPYHTGYVNHASLLRPNDFVQKNNLVAGDHARLNRLESGMPDILVNITAVHSLYKDSECVKWAGSGRSRPVIGIYSYQTDEVQQFIFKDKNGLVTTINSTPNHPFYVAGLNRYLPINQIIPSMKLLDKEGRPVFLSGSREVENHYGISGHTKKIFTVHNIEIYQQHHYFAGKAGILVHNTCGKELDKIDPGSGLVETLQNKAFKAVIKSFLTGKLTEVGKTLDSAYMSALTPETGGNIVASIKSYNEAALEVFNFLDYEDNKIAAFKKMFCLDASRYPTFGFYIIPFYLRSVVDMLQLEPDAMRGCLKAGEEIRISFWNSDPSCKLIFCAGRRSFFSRGEEHKIISSVKSGVQWYNGISTESLVAGLNTGLMSYSLKPKPFYMHELKGKFFS